jgi:hypothetical protein
MKRVMTTPLFVILMAISLLPSCAELFGNRSFIDEMERDTDGFFVPGKDFMTISGDGGNPYRTRKEILERTPASRKEKERYNEERSLNEELANKESLLSAEEYEKYIQVRPQLESVSEQIYYLNLKTRERDSYLVTKGIKEYRPDPRDLNFSNAKSQFFLITGQEKDESELKVGMDKNELTKAWGRPSNIEIAGNPRYQNERWSFRVGGKTKKVFLENGVVQGWSME